MSQLQENMAAIVCGRCNVPIPLLYQSNPKGVPTFAYHCTSCHGKVCLQIVPGPDGNPIAKQVQLTNSPDEFKPDSIRPNQPFNLPVAYTLGASSATQHVPAPPIQAPVPAYTLDPKRQPRHLPPNHPMHPEQIRKRIQPIRWNGTQ